ASTLDAILKEIEAVGRRGVAGPTGVVDRDQVRALALTAFTQFGHIDVLGNAAFPGSHPKNGIDKEDEHLDFSRGASVMLACGKFVACRFVAPYRVEAGKGSIVNLTSMSSRLAYAGRSDYAAGKAAVHRLGWALADELGPSGVRVNAVAPGLIMSPVLEDWMETTARERGITYEEQFAE